MMNKLRYMYRVQGLSPESGQFTEIYTNNFNKAREIADILYFGEIRSEVSNNILYRDGAFYDSNIVDIAQ